MNEVYQSKKGCEFCKRDIYLKEEIYEETEDYLRKQLSSVYDKDLEATEEANFFRDLVKNLENVDFVPFDKDCDACSFKRKVIIEYLKQNHSEVINNVILGCRLCDRQFSAPKHLVRPRPNWEKIEEYGETYRCPCRDDNIDEKVKKIKKKLNK